MRFYELAIGAQFSFRGRHFTKIAMSMAHDEQRVGNIVLGHTEVTCEGEPLLLSPEEAARWNPDDRMESDALTPAPPAKKLK